MSNEKEWIRKNCPTSPSSPTVLWPSVDWHGRAIAGLVRNQTKPAKLVKPAGRISCVHPRENAAHWPVQRQIQRVVFADHFARLPAARWIPAIDWRRKIALSDEVVGRGDPVL